MQKIPTVFVRDDNDRRYVTDQVNPACQWVLDGEGVATRKYDGTCVMFDGREWWARREVKPGKVAPENYVPLGTDEVTGKTMGWEPIEQSSYAKYHAEALNHFGPAGWNWTPGTYELVGPRVNGNPERVEQHTMQLHAWADVLDRGGAARSFDAIKGAVLAAARAGGLEGIVYHHPDGRMAKIKARDFRQTSPAAVAR
ncbi:MAG TPA: hypothetical protein VK453_25690 [Micromonosporaceae bacterium]|nr:hypothetical protein [Micromonosporaceae bacterium]